jgi:hypothetical protein
MLTKWSNSLKSHLSERLPKFQPITKKKSLHNFLSREAVLASSSMESMAGTILRQRHLADKLKVSGQFIVELFKMKPF